MRLVKTGLSIKNLGIFQICISSLVYKARVYSFLKGHIYIYKAQVSLHAGCSVVKDYYRKMENKLTKKHLIFCSL